MVDYKSFKPPLKSLWLIPILLVYLLVAWNSKGYYHFDEHYQIIEFAGIKLGFTEPYELSWEYDERIRPSFQPVLCVVIISTLNLIGINDPYNLALALRIFTSLLAFASIGLFVRSTEQYIAHRHQNYYWLVSYFLWFIPFISVRFSSETWSSLFFLFAISLLLRGYENKGKYFLIGVLLGVSFQFRFQIAFMAVGLLTWAIVILKVRKVLLYNTLLGGTIVLIIGFILDSWFYGQYTLSWYNYLLVNALTDSAPDFSSTPWYQLFIFIYYDTIYPIGLIISLSFIALVIWQPSNFVVWVTLPFLFLHMLFSHKEMRFLFPLAYFTPLVIMLGWQQFCAICVQQSIPQIMRIIVFSIVLIASIENIIAAVVMTFKPADFGRKNLTSFIDNSYKRKNVRVYYTSRMNNPNEPLFHLNENFYNNTDVSYVQIADSIVSKIPSVTGDTVLLYVESIRSDKQSKSKRAGRFVFKTRSMPDWIIFFLDYYHRGDYLPNVLELYEIKNEEELLGDN